MPTFGWVFEDAIERYWEAQPRRLPVRESQSAYPCALCEKRFSSLTDLSRHLRLEHSLTLPILSVHGQPLPSDSVLRVPLTNDDVALFHCSRCEIQIHGGSWQPLDVDAFRTRMTQPSNETWHVRLVHERPLDNAQAVEFYRIQFRIPSRAELHAVDALFITTLVREELGYADLEQFAARLPSDAPAREYGNALGDYALGVILKEGRYQSYAPVGFDTFVARMRSALDILRFFERPVALAVASSIRFVLNDFHTSGSTAAPDLEAALAFFRRITSADADHENTPGSLRVGSSAASQRPVCPVDVVSHRLLGACARLVSEGMLPVADLDALRDLPAGSMPLSEQDLAKLHVICAEGYLRLCRLADARPHVHTLQFDPVFRGWAERRLEDISPYGK